MAYGKNSKFSQEQQKFVLELYKKGESLNSISQKTGISYGSVHRIVRSCYPAKRQRTDHNVTIEPENSYGLNPYITKLKKMIKLGDKISIGSFKGEVIKSYENFFVVQGKHGIESFTYTNFLLYDGKIL